MIKVLIADDEPLGRARIKRLLAAYEGCTIVGEASNGEQAIELCKQLQPDLVMLDINMPKQSGLEVAAELSKPIIVHTREAQTDTLELMRAYEGNTAGVLHCFTESWEMAEQALDLGYYISISGIVTFRNADALRDVVRKVPLDRLLIETDSPYLAPVPKRGKPNDPSLLPYVAECVAGLKEISLEDLAKATTDNFFRLFSAAAPAATK